MIFKCLVRFVTTWNIVYIGVFKLIFLTNLFAGQVFLIIECARLYLLNLEKCIFTADTSIILCKYTINVPGIHFKIFSAIVLSISIKQHFAYSNAHKKGFEFKRISKCRPSWFFGIKVSKFLDYLSFAVSSSFYWRNNLNVISVSEKRFSYGDSSHTPCNFVSSQFLKLPKVLI